MSRLDEYDNETLKFILKEYDAYVIRFWDEHDEGDYPVCLNEWLDHEGGDLLETRITNILIKKLPYAVVRDCKKFGIERITMERTENEYFEPVHGIFGVEVYSIFLVETPPSIDYDILDDWRKEDIVWTATDFTDQGEGIVVELPDWSKIKPIR